MTTSRINIRRTSRGTTIRATGSAAQALFDAITGAAERTKATVEEPATPVSWRKYLLCIRVEYDDEGYSARALIDDDTDEGVVSLLRKSASKKQSESDAVEYLLSLATPPLHVMQWKKCEYSNQGRTADFTVIAEPL